MNDDILRKIAAIATDNGLDAIVATSPENFAYLAGFVVPSHHILRWRHRGNGPGTMPAISIPIRTACRR